MLPRPMASIAGGLEQLNGVSQRRRLMGWMGGGEGGSQRRRLMAWWTHYLHKVVWLPHQALHERANEHIGTSLVSNLRSVGVRG